MEVRYRDSAWRHAITPAEIRAVLAYPLLRYRVATKAFPAADSYMFIAQIGQEPWLYVGAEDKGDHWEVFHASRLTNRVAVEVYELTKHTIDLRSHVIGQRI